MGSAGIRRVLVWLPPAVLGAFALGVSLWACPLASTGCRCPGCGMTRAMGALSRGDFEGSFQWHPFAPGFLLGWAVLALYEVLGRRRATLERAVAGVETRWPISSLFLGAFAIFGVGRLILDVASAVG